MDDKVTLLPCPCCGGMAELRMTSLPDSYSDHWVIACTKCDLMNDNADEEQWNRRQAQEAPKAEDLQEVIGDLVPAYRRADGSYHTMKEAATSRGVKPEQIVVEAV